MTKWRVSATIRGKRVCTSTVWDSVSRAQAYADETNKLRPGSRALVVRDSEKTRKLIA